ncbi:MAG: response regulator [Phycisphaeraceae bacterium]
MNTHRPITDAPPQAKSQASPQPAPQVANDQQELDVSGSVILIVDDNTQNLELLQAYLESLPCTIITATDGIEAMKIIDARRSGDEAGPLPDLVLLDVMMPRMSGFEVCRKLKEDPTTRSIPIMMVTALNELGDIERGVESGTDDFVTKPVNKLELTTRVKSLLRVRHLKRELDRTMAYIRSIDQGRPNLPAGDRNADPISP